MACVNFCKTKSFIGILSLFSMVIDCKMVEIPPKLITKVQAATDHTLFIDEEISMHPFVISINPSRMLASGEGKRLKIGESDVIITKNIAMIVPTEMMLKAESKTILDRSALFFDTLFCSGVLSSLMLILRYKSPFKSAPIIWEIMMI